MRSFRAFTALALSGALAVSTQALAAPETYELDPTHSFIEFSISHLGFSILKGRFNEMEGSFTYDAEKPENNSVEVTVKTASLDSNHAERDEHLRNEDFLHVEKYPVATFKSKRFEPEGEGGTLHGDLTLHGETKPIEVDVEFIGAGEDPWGGYRRGYVGTTTIRQADWGIDYDLGPAAETMELQFFIEGIRQ